jgi:hypothetical protein
VIPSQPATSVIAPVPAFWSAPVMTTLPPASAVRLKLVPATMPDGAKEPAIAMLAPPDAAKVTSPRSVSDPA